jgi:hypothetical protein
MGSMEICLEQFPLSFVFITVTEIGITLAVSELNADLPFCSEKQQKQDRQYTYDVTMKRVRVSIVAVGNQ